MGRVKELKGQIFGHLLVLKQEGINNQNRAMWLCKCDCGIEKRISSHDLKHGTISCGHIQTISRMKNMAVGWGVSAEICKENAKIKATKKLEKAQLKAKMQSRVKRLLSIWNAMKERCYREKHMHYHNYGGRGITMCNEWLNDYYKFEKWALNNGYNGKLTIDRIDNDGNYEPNNCKWSTCKEQMNNTRSNVIVNINGVIKTIPQWCDEYNLKYSTLRERINRGWTGTHLLEKVGEY